MPSKAISISELDDRGANASTLRSLDEIDDLPDRSAVGIEIPIGRGLQLQALVLKKARGLPVVAQFHGALDKSKYAPPRFERLATLRDLEVNSIFFADPTIMLHSGLQLAWYTAWIEFDLHALIGRVVSKIAAKLGGGRVITAGSSGGGFAALQVAPHVRGSIAVPMNPQTAIPRYRVEGVHMGPQRTYRRHVMPELGNPDEDSSTLSDWWLPMAHRLSAVERYRLGQRTTVNFWQNVNDAHHVDEHYRPFIQACASSGIPNLKCFEYEGPAAHVQPTTATYLKALTIAIEAS